MQWFRIPRGFTLNRVLPSIWRRCRTSAGLYSHRPRYGGTGLCGQGSVLSKKAKGLCSQQDLSQVEPDPPSRP